MQHTLLIVLFCALVLQACNPNNQQAVLELEQYGLIVPEGVLVSRKSMAKGAYYRYNLDFKYSSNMTFGQTLKLFNKTLKKNGWKWPSEEMEKKLVLEDEWPYFSMLALNRPPKVLIMFFHLDPSGLPVNLKARVLSVAIMISDDEWPIFQETSK